MRKILEKPFLSRRISKLLTTTIAKNEFTSTFIDRHLQIKQAGKEEDKEDDVGNEDVSQEGNKIEMSRPKLNIKPQGKKIRFQPGPTAGQNQHG
jgi:hypothetical protein